MNYQEAIAEAQNGQVVARHEQAQKVIWQPAYEVSKELVPAMQSLPTIIKACAAKHNIKFEGCLKKIHINAENQQVEIIPYEPTEEDKAANDWETLTDKQIQYA